MNNMVFENEITVEVDTTFENLKLILEKKGFKLIKECDYIDLYMLKNDSKETEGLKILNDCVLLRNIISLEKDIKLITYKFKEYNEKKEITRQGKVECEVKSLQEAQNLLEILGYHKLIKIVDHIKVFSDDKTEFAVQLVNDKHIYIELEDNGEYGTIEKMKEKINSLDVPLKTKDYFVKKALIELEESNSL